MINIFAEANHFCNLSTSCFHFERFISQNNIRLIDTSKDGFHPRSLKLLIFSQKEIIFLSFCKSNYSYILECRFHFENLYCRRKFFWLTLQQKNLILYMKMEYIIPHYFVSFCRRNLPIFQNVLFRYGQDIIYSTRTSIFQINSKRKSLFFIGPSGGTKNSPFYKNRNKCGKFGWNPSAKNGSVHFLLGAMLPCSAPFCTSGVQLAKSLDLVFAPPPP